MRTIATLQQPDCGSIKFNGIDILRDKTALRRTLGYLPQEFGAPELEDVYFSALIAHNLKDNLE
jgi:ABC-type multidrug transport system ATPase subunit